MNAKSSSQMSISYNTPSRGYGFYDNPLSRAVAIFIRVQEFLERGSYRDRISRDEHLMLKRRLTYDVCNYLLDKIKSHPLIFLVPKEVNVQKAPGIYSYLNLKELKSISIRSENTYSFISVEKFTQIQELCRIRFGTGSGNIKFITIRKDAYPELLAYRNCHNKPEVSCGYYANSRAGDSSSIYTIEERKNYQGFPSNRVASAYHSRQFNNPSSSYNRKTNHLIAKDTEFNLNTSSSKSQNSCCCTLF